LITSLAATTTPPRTSSSTTADKAAVTSDRDALQGVVVATGDSRARTKTPPPASLTTTDVAAAANDTDWVEGTLLVVEDMCIKGVPVTPVATNSFTAQAPTTTPPPTSSWTTDNTAATNETVVAMGVFVSTGDSFLQSKPLVPLATGTAETWPTALPATHVAGEMHTCNAEVSMLLMTVSMHTSTTPAQGRMNP